MPPRISSTAAIGDESFNLTVKPYQLPLSGNEKQKQISNFSRTVTGLAAGNTATVTLFNSIPTASKFIIQSIIVNAMLTTSASAPKTLNWLKCTLTASGSNSWGNSLFPVPSNFQDKSIINFYCSPGAYPAELIGPLYVQTDFGATLALTVIGYAAITLNDIIQVQCQIIWQPVS